MAVKKKNNKLLIGLGIAGALVGIGIFTYPSLKKLFKPDEEKPEEQLTTNLPPPDQNSNGNNTQSKTETPTETKEKGLNIYKKNKYGDKSKEVTAIQTIINLMSQLRGTYGKTIQVDGKALKLPVGIDGNFGGQTKLGALYSFPATFKDSGFVTLYNARKKFAYATGYYNQGFPSNLIGTTKEEDYRASYMIGKADGKKKK